MPYEISFDRPPHGCVLSAVRKGEKAKVAFMEFSSSEDGDRFIQRLDGLASTIIAKLPPEARIRPSIIDHLLAIIRKDGTATVYVNEVGVIQTFRAKRSLAQGEPLYDDDIADIYSHRFQDIEIPSSAGFLYVFSVGWRKGLYYDFSPTLPDAVSGRSYDVEVLLAQLYTYLRFQDLFKISEREWDSLFKQSWFPFVSLNRDTIREILNYNRNFWNVDELLPRVAAELEQRVTKMTEGFSSNPFLAPHQNLIAKAVERYLEGDHISAISILYPRIEGVMRSIHMGGHPADRVSQRSLVDSTVDSGATMRHDYSLLMPEKFRRYLSEVYFANFDPNKAAPLSRHTVAHGVADATDFSLKGSTLGFLVLDQLFYLLPPQANTDTS